MSTPPLPAPPPASHRETLRSLAGFQRGMPQTRLARARTYLAEVLAQIHSFHSQGAAGLSTARLLAAAMDALIRGLFEELQAELESPPGLSLVALGSFGRRELSPHSDLDLLLLRAPNVSEEEAMPLARAFPTLLWDVRRAVGWSARTLDECLRAVDADHTVHTALLDSRFLAGDPALYVRYSRDVLAQLLGSRSEAFIENKIRELAARREKFGDSVFLLEPHLKQGDGGLRDLESALWIARARFETRELGGLLQRALLPAGEIARLRSARDLLLRIRHELHFLRGKKEDRLTFDLQEAVARFLGYPGTAETLPVEAFMRDYYLAAKALGRAADGLISRCEEGREGRLALREEARFGPFRSAHGKLRLEEPEAFESAPATVLDAFRIAEEESLALHSSLKERITAALPWIEAARAEPAVVEALKALLALPGSRGEHLFELHELGVLGALVPEFGRITAHHQHDLYHVYTVDVHLLFALRRLYALRAQDLVEEVPELTREMRELGDPLPLYLGTLMHDAGKGLGGNHSEKGRALMEALGLRLGLTARQKEIAEFLVLHHLLMSHTAQRRDLSDSSLVASFAEQMGDVEKLTCLYLLTYADLCSVGPKVWTAWKGQLLRELFEKARAHLVGTHAPPEARTRERFRETWARRFGAEKARAWDASLPERYFLGTEPTRAFLHGRLLERATRQPLAAALRHPRHAASSELSLAAPDRPGLLALFAGILSAHRIDILSARITSTASGLALDVFEVRSPEGPFLDRPRWRAARRDLLRVLRGEAPLEDVFRKRRASRVLEKSLPRVFPRVTVDNRASQVATVLDVRAQDRVGLLHAIASALNRAGTTISLAKVATEAHRAVDAFYVVTPGGAKVEELEALEALVGAVREALESFEREALTG